MKRIQKVGLTNFILLISSLILVMLLIGFSFIKNSDSADEIAHSWEVKNDLRRMSSTISKLESFGLAYEYTRKVKFKIAFVDAQDEYDSLLVRLKSLVSDNSLQANRLLIIDKEVDKNFSNIIESVTKNTDTLNLVAQSKLQDMHIMLCLQSNLDELIQTENQFLDELIQTENQFLEERNRRYAIWKFVILGALGIATIIAFLSLYSLFQRIKPLIEELLSTQDKLESTNSNLKSTLTELKDSHKDKVKEIKAKEKAIEEASKLNESLIAKNQQLDHFAYVASHDLQEPLRTVSNYIEIFQEDFPERIEGEAILYFDFINKAVERMRKLISGLLSFSRLGTSGEMEEINLNKTLKKIKEDYSVIIENRGIEIESDELPKIIGYKIEIKQLFQNLISNAIKFTPADVTPNIQISYEETKNYYNFHITDNGVGIPEKDFTKVFDMFSRLHSIKDYEGQGIGLAFCKKIVELHLGNIWVSSIFGEGTTVHFTLKK